MNWRFLFFLIGFNLFSSCFNTQQFSKNGKVYLHRLASPDFHGRGYTHNGLQKAEHYLQNEFKKIGISPSYPNYLQSANYSINQLSFVQLKLNHDSLSFGKDYIISASAPTLDLEKQTLLIDWASPFLHLQEKDKIPVFDFTQLPKNITHQKAIEIVRQFQENAFNLVVEIKEKLTFSASSSQSPLVVIEIKPGLIHDTDLLSLKTQATLQQANSHNIVGHIAGTHSDSAVFITAHYDHLGQINDAIFYGANDNASGVAMLLNLAKYYKKHPPKFSLYFYALTGEEAGLWGSLAAVDNLPVKKNLIKLNINLDILGTGSEGLMMVGGNEEPKLFDLMSNINKNKQLLPVIKSRKMACNSDQCIFYNAGIPAVFLYTMGGAPYYHDIDDKASVLSLSKFNSIGELLISFINQIP